MFPFFLSSGLFLGWSLGANNMSNVFGTAVGTRMIRFRTAAIWCSIFIILGSVISGAGATQTLGKLGAINALAGAFMVALSSAITMFLMTKASYPVSTSQTIVGSIVGWNLFSGSLIDYSSLTKILSTWIFCPLLSAAFSMALYLIFKKFIQLIKPHMLFQDSMTRLGLLLAGMLGAYALGANNISTVMGVFVPISTFKDIQFLNLFTLSAAQQLFLLGGLAIAVGVFTYSKRVIMTVGGGGIMHLSPIAAFIVVVSHSLVLLIFSSQGLSNTVTSLGLPPIPLVPVSSSQAIVGAVIGIGMLSGGRAIRWRMVGAICSSWAVTPIIAAAICFVSLFFLQNVFQQQTYRVEKYSLDEAVFTMLKAHDVDPEPFRTLENKVITSQVNLRDEVRLYAEVSRDKLETIMDFAKLTPIEISGARLNKMPANWLTEEQRQALWGLRGKSFRHAWQLHKALENTSEFWQPKAGDAKYNKELSRKLDYITTMFKIE